MQKIVSSDKQTRENNDAGSGRVVSNKPFPDESNREAIEEMLQHALQWAIETGVIDIPQDRDRSAS